MQMTTIVDIVCKCKHMVLFNDITCDLDTCIL